LTFELPNLKCAGSTHPSGQQRGRISVNSCHKNEGGICATRILPTAERRGSIVVHPTYPWTPTVHSYLRHLESRGFQGSQRVVGSGYDDSGNETLSWTEGDLFPRSVWPGPEESLHSVGALLHQLHQVSRDFVPPPDAEWMNWTLHSSSPESLVSHGNVAPWHVVFRNGTPVGFIGWEYSGLVALSDEVAVTAWYCVQMFDGDIASEIGLPNANTRAIWFKSFQDGYGVEHSARADLIERMLHFAIRDNGMYCRDREFTQENSKELWPIVWQSRAALRTLENRDLLSRVALS
jgi:hypothetical protein